MSDVQDNRGKLLVAQEVFRLPEGAHVEEIRHPEEGDPTDLFPHDPPGAPTCGYPRYQRNWREPIKVTIAVDPDSDVGRHIMREALL